MSNIGIIVTILLFLAGIGVGIVINKFMQKGQARRDLLEDLLNEVRHNLSVSSKKAYQTTISTNPSENSPSTFTPKELHTVFFSRAQQRKALSKLSDKLSRDLREAYGEIFELQKTSYPGEIRFSSTQEQNGGLRPEIFVPDSIDEQVFTSVKELYNKFKALADQLEHELKDKR